MPAAGPSMPDVDAIVIRLRLEHSNNGQGRSVPHATQIQFRTKLPSALARSFPPLLVRNAPPYSVVQDRRS